jgi:drug/metabolite transporter (DMT)-like permease
MTLNKMNSAQDQTNETQKILGNLAFLFGVTIWSTMFPATEYLLINWDPVAITFIRMSGGALVLLIAFVFMEDFSSSIKAAPWGKIILLGIVGVSVSTLLFAWGIKLSSAIAAALIAATGPIVATLITRLVYAEPLRKGIVLGVLLAVAGGVCAVRGNGDRFDELRGGEFVVLMAMSLWVWYSYNCQRWLSGIPQIGIAALTVTAGALGLAIYVVVAQLSGFDNIRFGTSHREWIILVWLSVGPASTSIFLWHFGISRIGVTIGAMYQNLVPIVVILISVNLGRHLTMMHLIAGILIISGVLYTQIRNIPKKTIPGTPS